jgi:predicted translin family RNA/ssDNA-binding protein
MTQEATLSQQVRGFLDTLDWEDDHDSSPEEREEMVKIRATVKVIVDDLIASRETLTDNRLKAIEKLVAEMPDAFKGFLDDRYTRKVIDAIPGYVRRTMELSRLEGSRIPSKITNGYLEEAVRTYIFGFPQASIALSRAALEQALKEELGHQCVKTFLDMNSLLDEAEGLGTIDGVIRKTARKIASEADAVLHEKPADPAKAYEVLVMLRGVLQHIYAG